MKRLVLALLVLTACGDDDDSPLPVQRDAGGVQDAAASLDASRSASLDASSHTGDASPAPQADASLGECTLDQAYQVRFEGGLVAYRDSYELAGAQVVKTRAYSGRVNPAVDDKSCSYDIASCRWRDRVDAGWLRDALADSSVVAAFSEGGEVLGLDYRPVDGTVLVVARADGKEIWIGADCGMTPGCTPIPEGVAALRTMLGKLFEEHPGDPARAAPDGSCPPE